MSNKIIRPGDGYISGAEIEDKINELLNEIAEYDDIGETPPVELTAELEMWDEVRARIGSQNVTLILEERFPEYVEEMASDLGYVGKDVPEWIVVDWEKSAEKLNPDYSDAEIDGYRYLYNDV